MQSALSDEEIFDKAVFYVLYFNVVKFRIFIFYKKNETKCSVFFQKKLIFLKKNIIIILR